MIIFNETKYALYNFTKTINYMDDNYITPFRVYIKNMLRTDSISLETRLEMFLLAEDFLPIKLDFMWLDSDYILDSSVYCDILNFENLVLFKDLIPLIKTFTDEYPAIYQFDKELLLEHIVRSGYRGFIIQ